jgi:LPXTG-site transpeptidase (sortase) family protein
VCLLPAGPLPSRWAPLAMRVGALSALVFGFVLHPHADRDDPPAGAAVPRHALADERPAHAAAPRTEPDAAPPRSIRIPAIGVDARVVPLGLARDGTMETPADFAATGWYEPGREPGERGPAVIAGHVDSTSGAAVFYRLGELERGDDVDVARADGSVVRFRVEGVERWPKDEFPTKRVFGDTPAATLRLITCSGDFDESTGHYLDNTVVYAARVSGTATSGAR